MTIVDNYLQKKLSRQIRNRKAVAAEVLRSALSWEPNVYLLGNIMACEIASLAAFALDTCPLCHATAWVNIDCDLCLIVTQLSAGEIP